MSIERNTEGLLEQVIVGPDLERARRALQDKTLWVVPNWNCNRVNKPCKICFATDIMTDAKTKGYQSAGADFFAKLMLLSQLPFKEVVIPGGEPTQNLELFKTTLALIDSQRKIRVITNGDWALRETAVKGIPSREEVLDVIYSSNKRIRVEISAHDSPKVFKSKIEALKGRVELGAQLRLEEGLNHVGSGNYINLRRSIVDQGIFLEERHVLALGNTKGRKLSSVNHPVSIDLKQLTSYTNRKNMGVYLIAGEGGARVIANHEAPYLVYPTPADVVDPGDTAPEVLRKTFEFLVDRIQDVDDIGFAAAAFKNGQPIIGIVNITKPPIHYYFSVAEYRRNCDRAKARGKKLMDAYYGVIAEKSHLPTEGLKRIVASAIMTRMEEVVQGDRNFFCQVSDNSVVARLAYWVPHDPASFASIVAKGMLTICATTICRRRDESKEPPARFLYRHLDDDNRTKLQEHLEICGLSLKDIQIQI